jgi:hypothetical protein
MVESGRRLSYEHGQWSLETSELVRLDRDLYRPEKRRIDGTEAILAHLRSRGEGALMSAAERLIRVSDVDGSAYEAHDGEWIQAERRHSSRRPSRGDHLAEEVAELRAELIFLRAAYSGLADRVRRAERALAEPAAAAPAASRAQPAALQRDAAAAAAASSRIALPQAAAIVAGLRQLIGSTFMLEQVRESLPSDAAELSDLDSSVFVDDSGRECAALVANHRGTVECGGQLLGVAPELIEEQVRSGEAETELVLGMSEIVNNLSGLVTREANNPPLRAEPLTKASFGRMPWLYTPAAVLAFATPTGGRLWLVAR